MTLSGSYIPVEDLNPFRVSIQDKFTTDELEKIMEEHNTSCCGNSLSSSKSFIPNVELSSSSLFKSVEIDELKRTVFSLKADSIASAVCAMSEETPVELLSEYQKLGILFLANVTFYTSPQEGYNEFIFKTFDKVGIVLNDGQYLVISQKTPPKTYC